MDHSMKVCGECEFRLYPLTSGTCPEIVLFTSQGPAPGKREEARMGCQGAGMHTLRYNTFDQQHRFTSEETWKNWKKAFLIHINDHCFGKECKQ